MRRSRFGSRIGQGIEEAQSVAEIGQCLGVGPTALRFLCGEYCVIYRLFGLVAAPEMKGEQFGHLVAAVAVELFEGVSDSCRDVRCDGVEEAPIGRFLRQRMAKDINSPVADDALIEEFETIELAATDLRSAPHPAIRRSAGATKTPGR